MPSASDAVVVGAGPNGLAAAIVLAEAGRSVILYEAHQEVGGGSRSAELTIPGFVHDICSTIHAFAAASPYFRTLPLENVGVRFVEPRVSLAHPMDDGSAAVIVRSVEDTADRLGPDAAAYRSVVGSVVSDWPKLEPAVLSPIGLPLPKHPFAAARFGWRSLRPASEVAQAFTTPRARALFGGIAAHGMLPLGRRPSAAFAMVLGALAHTHGWVVTQGGAQRLADGLAQHFRSLGGRVVTGHRVASLDELPASRIQICDLTPRPFLEVAGHRLPRAYRDVLERYRYGMAAFKLDWALDGPIPWRASECAEAGTLHLGGTFEEIAHSEDQAWRGLAPDKPFVILVQATVIDPTRAPDGKHTAWGYCHVPGGSAADMTTRIEAQIERFAPGFRDRILARSVRSPAEMESDNPNLAGGDIGGGVSDLMQLFARPSWRMHATPVSGLYLCSAATPPGVGVHGMCGYHAARMALARRA